VLAVHQEIDTIYVLLDTDKSFNKRLKIRIKNCKVSGKRTPARHKKPPYKYQVSYRYRHIWSSHRRRSWSCFKPWGFYSTGNAYWIGNSKKTKVYILFKTSKEALERLEPFLNVINLFYFP
jgi:hypothetical protein